MDVFFNDKMENMPTLSEKYKRDYCLSDFEKCARYMVFKTLGKPKVPNNLFPNMQEKATKIISEG